MKIRIFSLFAVLLIFSCDYRRYQTTIAFGSCSHEFDSIQMWDQIIKHKPSAWIWMGDNIYGDTEDMDVMQRKYDLQKLRPSYQNLINKIKVYGIWDDHDYGVNDGGKEYPMKNESKVLMLDFLDVPKESAVYNHQGAYQAYTINQNGIEIKLILLDTRYFRETLKVNLDAPPLYVPNEEGTILGEDQWKWLEKQFRESTADMHLVGSSYQLIPNNHGYEKWGNFPNERKRFFDLIVKTKPKRPIILSGDRHIAEFSKINLDGLSYPLYEFTSSGLTHTWSTERPEKNEHRVGDLIIAKNFGLLEIEKSRKSFEIKMKIYGNKNELLQALKAIF